MPGQVPREPERREGGGGGADGVRQAFPAARILTRPVADGGEGTLSALVARGGRATTISAAGPLGIPRDTQIVEWRDSIFIELAAICGISLLQPTAETALSATSLGLGHAIRAAGELRQRRIVITLGGSASTDGGAGALAGLGFILRDADGRPLLGHRCRRRPTLPSARIC